MKKICHVVEELRIGGLERTVIQIASGLERSLYSQEIWCLREKGVLAEEAENKGIAVKQFDFQGGISLPKIIKLADELKRGKFQIVHSHDIYPSVWAIAAAAFAGVPYKIMHCQSTYYALPFKDKIKLKFLSLFIDRFIAVSKAVKLSLEKCALISAKKIEVVYNCCARFNRSPEQKVPETLREFGIKEGDFVIASISRLEAHKGHSYLVEALSGLKDVQGLKCLIIGDGPAKRDLELLCESLGVKGEVIFTGMRSDISRILSVASVYVQPSALREGLPLTLAEAASAGLPLIATNIGGNPEIVRDPVNGFIVEPKDPQALAEKILYLRNNPEKRKSMGENSQKLWRESFSEEVMLGKIRKIYE
ncbi:MAG: glycosyltransferase [Candidatus Omnitrophica bacterium]|nr:glycosyltransferase [Candidatus Omnitrophota bacterium]